jgi:hypothetical protein
MMVVAGTPGLLQHEQTKPKRNKSKLALAS